MKKIIVLCSMIVALGFVTTGCGGGDGPATSTPVTQTAPDNSHEGHDHGTEVPATEVAE